MAAKKLSSMKGSEKFLFAMVEEGRRDMDRWFRSKKRTKLLMKEVHKHIFELGPAAPPGKRTPQSWYRQMVFEHCHEILRSIDTLKDIRLYVGRFPYSETKVDKHRHLQFHIEAFLYELYILQLRLGNFVTFIARRHGKDPRHAQTEEACSAIKGYVEQAMKNPVTLRSHHVHQWRFSDNQFDRLLGISLYMKMPSPKIRKAAKPYYESEYRKIRKHWLKWISDRIAEVLELADIYFDDVFSLVFDNKGKHSYPSNYKF